VTRQIAGHFFRTVARNNGKERDPKVAKKEKEAVYGVAASDPSEVGRVVTLHHDQEHEGKTYKAGTQDLPASVADHFIEQGLAEEPAGKKKGR
jgi:hypothetical protein